MKFRESGVSFEKAFVVLIRKSSINTFADFEPSINDVAYKRNLTTLKKDRQEIGNCWQNPQWHTQRNFSMLRLKAKIKLFKIMYYST